jgi:hypothetical protein
MEVPIYIVIEIDRKTNAKSLAGVYETEAEAIRIATDLSKVWKHSYNVEERKITL